jgi:hypothetical protein
MQHLASVNRMLVDLDAAPNLVRQDFPYEPDIYPFPLNLEPLTRESVAKYVYTEASAGALDRDDPSNAGRPRRPSWTSSTPRSAERPPVRQQQRAPGFASRSLILRRSKSRRDRTGASRWCRRACATYRS